MNREELFVPVDPLPILLSVVGTVGALAGLADAAASDGAPGPVARVGQERARRELAGLYARADRCLVRLDDRLQAWEGMVRVASDAGGMRPGGGYVEVASGRLRDYSVLCRDLADVCSGLHQVFLGMLGVVPHVGIPVATLRDLQPIRLHAGRILSASGEPLSRAMGEVRSLVGIARFALQSVMP